MELLVPVDDESEGGVGLLVQQPVEGNVGQLVQQPVGGDVGQLVQQPVEGDIRQLVQQHVEVDDGQLVQQPHEHLVKLAQLHQKRVVFRLPEFEQLFQQFVGEVQQLVQLRHI